MIFKQLKTLFYLLLPLLGAGVVGVSCSESEDENTEYENWQQRNETFFASLEDSLNSNPTMWMKFKSYTKDTAMNTGMQTDFIYAKKVITGYEQPKDTLRPLFNDSVRVSYRGRLIPSASYAEGYTFDSTVFGTYNLKTNSTARFKVSGLVDGFATALLHMTRFDTWRVYIPWKLGYGSTTSNSIPAYSTLIFDLTLYDFAAEGKTLPIQVSVK